jgi:hypothetical protein
MGLSPVQGILPKAVYSCFSVLCCLMWVIWRNFYGPIPPSRKSHQRPKRFIVSKLNLTRKKTWPFSLKSEEEGDLFLFLKLMPLTLIVPGSLPRQSN